MYTCYGTDSKEPTKLELKNRQLARKAAAEGFVLLKNNGALPLVNKRIALYGMGARKTVKGGLGSGSVEERYSVNIEDGLKNAGYEIVSEDWLNEYDEEYLKTYQEYHDMVEGKVAGLTNPMQIIPLAHSFVYRYPSGRLITERDIEKSNTDTAVYVLMRQAGEGNDRKLEKGDYYITDIERENLKIIAENYAHSILIVNVGGLIDFSFLDKIDLDAVVLYAQGGEEGGNALADVLSGKVDFSGKLADTIPMHYEDIPFGNEYSYLNGDLKNEYYKENIYVGYRYFDSFHKKVRYPFGFGLSYTAFSLKTEQVEISGTTVKLRVLVKNTGKYSGKEVVQVYGSAPQTNMPKEYQRLVAFEKTDEILPGESEEVMLSFDLSSCASYCEKDAEWQLEAGEYLIRVGNSSRNTEIVAVIVFPEKVITEQCKNLCQPKDEGLEDFKTAISYEKGSDDVLRLQVDPKLFKMAKNTYEEPTVKESEAEKKLLDSLNVEEMAELLRGGDPQRLPAGAYDVPGSAGKTATTLLDKGISNVCFNDGPAGINIINQVKLQEDGTSLAAVIPERYDWGILGKMMKQKIAKMQGKTVYRYATAWPVAMLQAQTWNKKLLYEIGDAVGAEAEAFGVTVWLAPAMNIHRNPLGGRTFEYYSEDPFISGKMAAALTKGVQSHDGIGVSIKHFCCNNTEDNRNGISSNVSERALREIYLKGFEIAIKESNPMTVMSSYNLLNHVYTCNNHDLLTDILRNEWGYEGLVMTDWGACGEKAAQSELCAPSGNDLVMPGSDWDKQHILAAVKNGDLNEKTLRRSAARVLHLILNAKVTKEKVEK